MAKKTTTKKTSVKKSAAKKVAAKKAPAKKTPVKKAPAKQSAPAKSVAARKAPVKKAPAKQSAPSKADAPAKTSTKIPGRQVEQTSIFARVDVGFGNSLYIRGEGADLSWDKGVLMENVSPYEWAYKTNKAKGEVTFKFLINDEVWAEGENLTVAAGGTSISSPVFDW
jgi:hypothetical protein